MPQAEMSFHAFSRARPRPPSVEVQQVPGITPVDIDPDPPDFFGSYDPGATSESDGEDRVISTSVWDTNAPLAGLGDDGDPNDDPNLQQSDRTASHRSLNPPPTGIARTDSQRNFDCYRADYIKATRRASSSVTLVAAAGPRQPPGRPPPKRQVDLF